MFENLSERLERSFKILKGEKDVRKALLEADVNYKVAKTFTDTVKQKALGQNVLTAVKPGQMMVKIVHDELAELMGGQATDLNLTGHPTIILMAGLNGAGKTTMSGKLALRLKTQNHKKPLLAACDTFRPAAMEQLRVLAEQVEVPCYLEEGATDPIAVAKNAIQEAKAKGYDVVIVDTAGRQSIDEELMQQIEQIKAAVNPNETLLVVDAMTGQDAVNTAKTFNERLEIDISPSSLWVRARKWKPSTCSIPNAWQTASSVWATSSHSWNVLSSSSTRKKQSVWRRRLRRTNSTITISSDK